jgi:hypothetical protein
VNRFAFLWPPSGTNIWWTRQRALTAGALAVFLLLGAMHAYVVLRHAVDIPFWDEWDVLNGINRPGLGWFLTRDNEHRLLFTRVEFWFLYLITGLDFRFGVGINLVLYGLLLWRLWVLCRFIAPDVSSWFLLACFWFLLSTLASTNLIWPIQSEWHVVPLCLATAYTLILRERPGLPAQLGYGALLVLATYSFAMGLVGSVFTAGWVLARAWWAPHGSTEPAGTGLRGEHTWSLLAVTAIVLAMAGLWFVGFHPNPGLPPNTLPTRLAFWHWYFDLIGAGFGFEHHAGWIGLLAVIGLLLHPLMQLRHPQTRYCRGLWAQLGFTLTVLMMAASVAVGRASYGEPFTIPPRYNELSMVLQPILAINLWRLSARMASEARGAVRAFTWGALLLGVLPHLSAAPYKTW